MGMASGHSSRLNVMLITLRAGVILYSPLVVTGKLHILR